MTEMLSERDGSDGEALAVRGVGDAARGLELAAVAANL